MPSFAIPTGPPGPPISAPASARAVPTQLERGGDGSHRVPNPAPVQRQGPPPPELPRASGSWSFASIGDFGGDTVEQARVAANILASRPELVLTVGDNAYPRGSDDDFARGYDPPHLLGGVRREIPIRPTLGNHDVTDVRAEPYFRRFPELHGARYYSFDHRGVHFTALDSTQSLAPGSPQHDWLERDLGTARAADFRIVYLHHPLVSDQPRGASNPRLGQLGALLARSGVDLLLAGHEHFYDRRPLPSAGTTQVTHGTGGHGLAEGLAPQHPDSARRELRYGHVDVEVRDDALVGRFVRDDGSTGDTFVVPRRSGG